VNILAYLRKEKHIVEIDYTITKIWKEIPNVLKKLEWKLEKTNNKSHQINVNTNASLLSYASMLLITVWAVDKKTTRVKIKAETPVTTITSLADFGRIRDRIELFFEALSNQLSDNKTNNSLQSEKVNNFQIKK
jgi:hypothetical protein